MATSSTTSTHNTAAPSRLRINIGIDASNNIKLRANAQEILKMTRDTRPSVNASNTATLILLLRINYSSF